MSIADRAAAAHQWLQRHSTHPLLSKQTATSTARTAARLAALLGVAPACVHPERDWNSLVLPMIPLTLTVRDPKDPEQAYVFSYRDPFYEDEDFLLLGPCPICAARVPLAAVRTLADLGAFLAAGPAPLSVSRSLPESYPDEFDRHPAHTTACPYRDDEF